MVFFCLKFLFLFEILKHWKPSKVLKEKSNKKKPNLLHVFFFHLCVVFCYSLEKESFFLDVVTKKFYFGSVKRRYLCGWKERKAEWGGGGRREKEERDKRYQYSLFWFFFLSSWIYFAKKLFFCVIPLLFVCFFFCF